VKERLLKSETGFTLAELLVTILLMTASMFALYAVFDMSLRVFKVGNDKVETVQNARVGLEWMRREIRAAYPVDKAGGDGRVLLAQSNSELIVFGNDLNGDRRVECPDPAVVPGSRCELIGYGLYRPAGNSTDALGRYSRYRSFFTEAGLARSRPAYPDAVAESIGSLTFEYLSENGAPVDPASARMVRITLEVVADEGSQRLTTTVALRNREG
jgi:hypothetical protein